MNVELTHELKFSSDRPPTIGELKALIRTAEASGFKDDSMVFIRGDDSQKDGYWLIARVTRPSGPPSGGDA